MFFIKNRTKKCLVGAALVLAVGTFGITAAWGQKTYLSTNRDTKPAPERVTYDLTRFDAYELLYETDTVRYYYREDRDIIAIEDKRNGYVWKTGIDAPYSGETDAAIAAAETREELELAAEPLESGMNKTYIGIANSLVTVEYYELETIKNISSASYEGAESTLYTLDNNPATRRLDVNFTKLDLQLKVYITFLEDGIRYDVPFEEITGEGKKVLSAVILTPFLGASGGEAKFYDFETGEYGDAEAKYMVPGYVLVPDGSGSLIRFHDNTAYFTEYIGDVYGKDPSQETYYYDYLTDAIPLKSPLMPVYGVAHGDKQAAFVAYAQSGDEYMEILVRPEENKRIKYTWAYPRFEYNSTYFQVYNKKGQGFFTMMEEPNEFDITMTYRFIAGDGKDGTPAADYTGMAAVYREYLLESGNLELLAESAKEDIPLRLDFILSDSKKGIVGTEQVVVTTAEDVAEILKKVREDGITNINSGLLGWQKGGETLAKPYSFSFTGSVGSKSDFKKLLTDASELGIDISFSRDFVSINKKMLNYYNQAARHVNSWYLELNKEALLPENAPVSTFGYATPEKSAQWLLKIADKAESFSESLTVTGLSNTLVSTYDSDGPVTTLSEAVELYQKTFETVGESLKLNLENPNMYLWKYTDRFLQMPVGGSQYIFETDSVPFLQMVLHGTMELYAPYANFSFYTQPDILRMIDYNLSPSFILSEEPSYYLADTASSDLYSTEFSQYRELITQIYGQVNAVLKEVQDYEWTGREVPESGVVINTYHKGSAERKVIINYTENAITADGVTVEPLSARVVK